MSRPICDERFCDVVLIDAVHDEREIGYAPRVVSCHTAPDCNGSVVTSNVEQQDIHTVRRHVLYRSASSIEFSAVQNKISKPFEAAVLQSDSVSMRLAFAAAGSGEKKRGVEQETGRMSLVHVQLVLF